MHTRSFATTGLLRRIVALPLLALVLLAPLARPAGAASQAAGETILDDEVAVGVLSPKHSRASALGDVDLDGDLDLVAEIGGYLRWYPNNGTGSPWSGSVPDRPISPVDLSDSVYDLALGDLNADGRLDLVVTTFDGLRIYLTGKGSSLWSNARSPGDEAIVLGGRNFMVLRLGDIDNDGNVDILTVSEDGVTQYMNPGGQAAWLSDLAGQVILPLAEPLDPNEALDLALGDLNRDGQLDLVFCDPGGCWQLLNSGKRDRWAGGATKIVPKGAPDIKVELGDMNGDAYLDLVIWQSSGGKLYLKDGATGTWSKPQTIAAVRRSVRALALGDFDADGDLDILVGGEKDTSPGYWLYPNGGPGVPWPPYKLLADSGYEYITDLTVGDVDGDRDLDIVTTSLSRTQVITNLGIAKPWQTASRLTDDTATGGRELALADFDGDRMLDLVVGTQHGLRYLSNGGPARPWPGFADGGLITDTWVAGVAAGDIDGDGHPDLALTTDQGTWAWFNTGSSPPFEQQGGQRIDSASYAHSPLLRDINRDGSAELLTLPSDGGPALHTYSQAITANSHWKTESITSTKAAGAAIADVDGDGDSDLLLTTPEPSLYLNDGGRTPWLQPAAPPLAATSAGQSIDSYDQAFGDVDGDGDLDLVIENRLVLNDGTGSPFSAQSPVAVIGAGSGALFHPLPGDVDGDGDLDLVYETGGAPAFLPNRGAAPPWPGAGAGFPPQETIYANRLALGDVDGDNDLDLVVGAYDKGTFLYLNRLSDQAHLQDSPPQLVVGQPRLTEAISGTVEVPFTLADPEGDAVREVRGFYSLDGGGKWLEAKASDITAAQNLPAPQAGASYTFTWDLEASGVMGASESAVFRLVALPAITPAAGRAVGPYRFASVAAATAPFRLQGMRVHVTYKGKPAQGARVYRLTPGQLRGGQLTPPQREGHPQLSTDHLGYLQGRAALEDKDRLVAMVPVVSTETYTLYHTSAPPSMSSGLAADSITAFGVKELEIKPANRLLLLNLTASVEWDARADRSFQPRLEADLKRASELLFRWSGGQIALGDITVYSGRQHWDDAHIRIYATNRMRPNAARGGIVPGPTSETVTIGGQERTIEYLPGQVRMGAVWNRYGEAGANLGDDWARTLAHELGHFALYLEDTYLGFDGQGRLVSSSLCPSPMTDPYDDGFGSFLPGGQAKEWDKQCGATLAQHETGRDEWATITAFYDLLAPEAFAAEDTPAVLPLAVTRVYARELTEDDPRPLIESPVLVLSNDRASAYRASAGAHAYLFQKGQLADNDQLVDLGAPTVDQVVARGARKGDTVCVFDPSQALGGCQEINYSYERLRLRDLGRWRPDIRVTSVTSTSLELEVLGATVAASETLKARLYPASGDALAEVTLTASGAGYGATLTSTAESPAFAGSVHVWVEPKAGAAPREAVVDFLLGGNPGSKWAHTAPRGNPGSKWAHTAPVLSSDGQAILYLKDEAQLPEEKFLSLMDSTAPAPSLAWAAPVGRAYRLTVPEGARLDNSSISIGYLADDVPRAQESGIGVYFLGEGARGWKALPTSLDLRRNEASALTEGPGLYALMSSVPLRLPNPGWNLVYFYPGATRPITEALLQADGAYTAIYGYDAADPADPWKSYHVSAPAWANDLGQLQHGQGYWIKATRPLTVALAPKPADDLDVASPDPALLVPPPATYYGLAPAAALAGATGDLAVTAKTGGAVCQATTARQVGGRVGFVIDVPAAGGEAQGGCGAPRSQVMIGVGACTLTTTWDNGGLHELADPSAWTCGAPASP